MAEVLSAGKRVVITKKFQDLEGRFAALMQGLTSDARTRREAALKVARYRSWLTEAEAELRLVIEQTDENKKLAEPYGELLLKLLESEAENLPALQAGAVTPPEAPSGPEAP